MANVLSLAMKINADASGFKLDPVQRALIGLGQEADKLTAQFDKFAGGSDAAAQAQARFSEQLQSLQNSLRDGSLGATQFAVEFEKLTAAANAEAQAFQEAAKITEASLTPLQKYQRTVAELDAQFKAGRISQETYAAAVQKAQANLDKTGESAGKTSKEVESLNKNLSILTTIEVGKLVVGGFQLIANAVQGAIGQVTSLASSVNSSLDSLNDLSARTGISVEDFQGFSLAAKLAGVDAAAFGTSVQRLGVEIGKASTGDGFDKSLQSIGLSVAELRALAPEQQFSAIGQAISQLPTAADRAAASVEIFGKQGAALAPLFREGAAGIDELRKEAEQLGIIVSQTQIDNVAAMNDAFDKVSATVQGIIGQVLGNLAPAVTEVTNQFLEFIKNFNSGEGGVGIANAITDVLLKGAEALASVFDYAVEQFNSFSGSLASASDVFKVVGDIFSATGSGFLAAVEALRVVFNVFELAGNALGELFGNFLSGLGSWVSSDLQAFGEDLARNAREAGQANSRELEQAAANAAKYATDAAGSIGNIFAGGSESAAAAGKGAASQFISNLSEELARSRIPEVKVLTGIEGAQEKLATYLKDAGDGADEFLKQADATLSAFKAAADAGDLSNAQVKVMLGFVDSLNQKLDAEAGKRRQAAAAAKEQSEADQKRVEALLKPSEEASKLEQDLAAVIREQSKAQEQLAAARASSSRDEADAAAARLAQLDQTRAKLEDLQQAGDQGFGDGFDKAFQATAKSLDVVIDKAAQFGNEGAKAAQQLQEGVARAQQQVRDGILSQAAYQAEVANQRRLAEERLAQLERERQAQQQAQQEAFQQQVDANNRVQEYLKSLVTDRARLEAEEFERTNNRKIEAAQNLKAIEDQIATQQRSVQAAREAGDLKAAKARQAELDALKKLKAAEQNIVDGKAAANQQINTAALASANAQAAQQQQFANAARQQVGQLQTAASNAIGLTNEAFAKAAERQQKLLNDLNTLGSRTVQTADVRTQEGAAIVLGLAANAQDPRLIEQRLANKVLREIAAGLTQNLNRIGIPAVLA